MNQVPRSIVDCCSSPEQFKWLRNRAKKAIWENPSPQDKVILEKIAQAPDSLSQEKIESVLGQSIQKIDQVVQRLLGISVSSLEEEKTPLSKASKKVLIESKVNESLSRMFEQIQGAPLRLRSQTLFDRGVDSSVKKEEILNCRKFPKKHRKAKTTSSLRDTSSYPLCLVDPTIRTKLVEGAVCMKFIFVGAFQKHFKKEKDVLLVDSLFYLHHLIEHQIFTPLKVLDALYKKLVEEKYNIEEVLIRLIDEQTLRDVYALPRFPSSDQIPSCFKMPPFSNPGSLKALFRQMIEVRFQYVGIYGSLDQSEKRTLDLLLQVGVVMDCMKFPFEKSVAILKPQRAGFKDGSVESLLRKIKTPSPVQIAAGGLNLLSLDFCEILDGFYFFQNKILFDEFIYYLKYKMQSSQSYYEQTIANIILTIDQRIRGEPISFKRALRDTFNFVGIAKIFNQSNQENLARFKETIISLSPKLFADHPTIAHPALRNEEAFRRLLSSAESYAVPNDADEELTKVFAHLQKLKTMDDLRWDQLVWFFFNEQALRKLFFEDTYNDWERAVVVNRCLKQISPTAS